MYAGISAGGMLLMIMDIPSNSTLTVGDNNITPKTSTDDKDEVNRMFSTN